MCRLSWNLGASISWNPLGHSRPVTGLLYLLPWYITRWHIEMPRQRNINLRLVAEKHKHRTFEIKFSLTIIINLEQSLMVTTSELSYCSSHYVTFCSSQSRCHSVLYSWRSVACILVDGYESVNIIYTGPELYRNAKFKWILLPYICNPIVKFFPIYEAKFIAECLLQGYAKYGRGQKWPAGGGKVTFKFCLQ